MPTNLTTKEYWRKTQCVDENKAEIEHALAEFFQKNLPKYGSKRMLEIGCSPGRFMAHLSKHFNYFPEGIDYIIGSKKQTESNLTRWGVNKFNVYEGDFFTWKTRKKYDLVCSFGFIEHFMDVRQVIKKHRSLLHDEGLLLITIPNFGGWQKLLHLWLDYENFRRHNLKIMDVHVLVKLIQEEGLVVCQSRYLGGLFDFWWENRNPSMWQKMMYLCLRQIANSSKIVNYNNKFLSPYLVVLARTPH